MKRPIDPEGRKWTVLFLYAPYDLWTQIFRVKRERFVVTIGYVPRSIWKPAPARQ